AVAELDGDLHDGAVVPLDADLLGERTLREVDPAPLAVLDIGQVEVVRQSGGLEAESVRVDDAQADVDEAALESEPAEAHAGQADFRLLDAGNAGGGADDERREQQGRDPSNVHARSGTTVVRGVAPRGVPGARRRTRYTIGCSGFGRAA